MICVHLFVSGMVQGVSFRRFTKLNADAFGLVGWVCNRDDGRVEAFACGEETKIDQFLSVIRKGNELSRVDGVEVSYISENEMHEYLSGFDIR